MDTKKYICTLCDWIYDPAVGDPDGSIAQEQRLKISLKIGSVRCAGPTPTVSVKLINISTQLKEYGYGKNSNCF